MFTQQEKETLLKALDMVNVRGLDAMSSILSLHNKIVKMDALPDEGQ